MIQVPTLKDTNSLLSIAVQTGLFETEEARSILGEVLLEYHQRTLGDKHNIQLFRDEENQEILGWIYFSPSYKSDRAWDLWWIGVRPNSQSKGVGGKLLSFAEEQVKKANGKILIIETSHTAPLDVARNFYLKRGYTRCGYIPDFYSDGDDKIIFTKKI